MSETKGEGFPTDSLILLILIIAQIVAGLMILDIPTYSFVWGLYAYLIVLEAYFVKPFSSRF